MFSRSLALLLTLSPAQADPAELANRFVSSLRCSAEVSRLITEWGAQRNEAMPTTPVFPGQSPIGITMPGVHIGRWIEVENRADGSIVARMKSSRASVEAAWLPKTCVADLKVLTRELNEKRMDAAFTDDDLRKLASSNAKGILYSWSPEMPHSVKGLERIRKTAAQLGLPLTVLLDPRASDQVAKAALKVYAPQEPATTLRKAESTELLNRNFTMHFPTVMVYANKRVVNRIYPGLANEKAYAEFIRESLK